MSAVLKAAVASGVPILIYRAEPTGAVLAALRMACGGEARLDVLDGRSGQFMDAPSHAAHFWVALLGCNVSVQAQVALDDWAAQAVAQRIGFLALTPDTSLPEGTRHLFPIQMASRHVVTEGLLCA